MDIRYTLPLLEDVVFREVQQRETDGDTDLLKRYHDLLDPIYEIPSDKREVAFERAYLKLFVELGFDEVMRQGIAKFPTLKGQVECFILTRAVTWSEEGADLSKNLRDVGIKLHPERIHDPDGLRQFLQHELMHVTDMLDEQFRYQCEERLAGETPTQENLVRDRYKIFWDTYIDGRLTRKRESSSDQNQTEETSQQFDTRFREFESLYRKIDPAYRKSIFERLWSAEQLTHPEILEMARDTRQLLIWARLSSGLPGVELSVDAPAPGYPCPLCQFPTYDWADTGEIGPEQIEVIRSDYPEWGLENGICTQCIEAYR